MNAFEQLLSVPDSEKQAKGIQYTPGEIAQQPEMWLKTCDILVEQQESINAFLQEAGLKGEKKVTTFLSGAGSSEYIGNAASYGLRRGLKRQVFSVSTTDFIIQPRSFLITGYEYIVISFARSGNSPESVATYNLVKQFAPEAKQIVITCNKDGELARTAKQDKNALCILLPEETNDRSLVMTSSFSTMAFTAIGLCFLDRLDELKVLAQKLGIGARRVMREYADDLKRFITQPVTRVSYLGSKALFGTMQECRLKMLEMTEGKIAANVNSFIGLRHGPQVFINDECLVVAALSSDSHSRQYELDLLRELQEKDQGMGTLVICDKATEEIRALSSLCVELYPNGDTVEDDYRIMTDVVVGQILGTFKSLAVGLKPDNPSTTGTISRVVQGVTIYPV
jgi:tagatose-6-phosphate ketose/aldose isomerase